MSDTGDGLHVVVCKYLVMYGGGSLILVMGYMYMWLCVSNKCCEDSRCLI